LLESARARSRLSGQPVRWVAMPKASISMACPTMLAAQLVVPRHPRRARGAVCCSDRNRDRSAAGAIVSATHPGPTVVIAPTACVRSRCGPNSHEPRVRGFTLIEVLVALGIVAVALVAGLQATPHSPTTRSARRACCSPTCARRTNWCAEAGQATAAVGDNDLACEQAGHAFVVRMRSSPTPNPSFRRVDAQVFDGSAPVCGCPPSWALLMRRVRGFTLVELLVSLFALALLAASAGGAGRHDARP
jgi:general secretion pathway protein I